MSDYNDAFENRRDPRTPYHPKHMNDPERERPQRPAGEAQSPSGSAGADRPRRTSRSRPTYNGRRRKTSRVKATPLFSILFFPCAILYHELLLRAFDADSSFFAWGALFRILFFSLAAGLLVFLLLDLIPQKTVSRWIGGLLSFAYVVVLCVERGMKGSFGMYYGVMAAADNAGDAVGNFADNTVTIVVSLIPFILLSLVPFVLFLLLRRSVFYEKGQRWPVRGLVAVLLVVSQFLGVKLSTGEKTKPVYTYDYQMNLGVPAFGLVNSIRLEFQYAIFGTPEIDLSSFIEDDPTEPPSTGSEPSSTNPPASSGPDDTTGPGGETTPPTEPPRVYGPNVIDSLDFNALAEGTSDKTIKQMHEYFGSLTPSMENEYTGLFAGKNLILLCAESFDDYVIDPELTPTLYRLTQEEGFVFTNFYQPDWTLSTCGGEFSVTTGVIPNWIGSSDSARKAIDNAMPTTLGNMFRAIGYNTPAWHNGKYTFYNRNKYLTTFGYDYAGEDGGGLDLKIDSWPRSDKEMIEATADSYINAYLETGKPFHAYYMTISGHGKWTFANNHRAADYKDLVQAKYPDLSEPCQAYIASNIDLDRALEVLVKKLEDAGIADDTLIVMAADHYPYFLATGNNDQTDPTDYYNELNRYFGNPEDSEKVTSRYKNTLLMWSASIPRTVVDTPCYSCDIVPTVLNLFGMDYDSRLYTGRDILDPNYKADEYSSSMPLVIFANNHGQGNSWITAAGVYEASTRTFTPNPGVTVPDNYVSKVKNLVNGKIQYAKKIITEDYYAKVFQ